MNIFESIILLLSTVINFSLQGAIALFIFKKNYKYTHLVIFSIVNALFRETLAYASPLYNPALYIIMYAVVMVLTLRFILKIGFVYGVISFFILMILSSIVEFLAMTVANLTFSSIDDITRLTSSFLILVLLKNQANLFFLVVVYIVRYSKLNMDFTAQYDSRRWTHLILNFAIVTAVIVPNMLFFQQNIIDYPLGLIIFNAAAISVMFFLCIHNIKKTYKLKVQQQELVFQELQIKTLEDLVYKLKGFKHDLSNMISVIGGYIKLNDIEGLKKYHECMQNECREINNILPLNTYLKDTPALYGMLLAKISYAQISNINFNLNITHSVKVSKMPVYEFCKVFGIMLDNALEAAEKSEQKFLELIIHKKNSKLIITISNSYDGEIDLEKIYEDGYSTKVEHSGFGLWEVKNILSKCKDCRLETFKNDMLFTQQLVINCDKA